MNTITTPLTQRRRRPGLLVQAGLVMIGMLGLALWLSGAPSVRLTGPGTQARADGPAEAAGSAASVPAALPVEARRPGAQPLLRLQIVSRCAGLTSGCAATLATVAVIMPGMNRHLDVSTPGGWAA